MAERTIGAEEELLLVDPDRGVPIAVAARVLGTAAARANDADPTPGGTIEHELQQEQIEIDTRPHDSLETLLADVRRQRVAVVTAAAEVGAAVAPLATSPVATDPTVYADERYERMIALYGPTGSHQLVCGMHVHVSIADDDEGIGVLDRIRPWLAALLALSANSPFWQGEDTTYESYRAQVWSRWPTAGPTERFGSAARYHELVESMIATDAIVDGGMIYFDTRLGRGFPTVEIRVADVCREPADAVLIAALCRGLVETAARSWAAGHPAPDVRTDLLRLASWRASRSGMTGDLVDPRTWRAAPAWEVVDALVDHVRSALVDSQDLDTVDDLLGDIHSRGTGATAQRTSFARSSSLPDVVRDACERAARS